MTARRLPIVGPIEDGQEFSHAGGMIVDVINPATGQVVARQSCCDQAAVRYKGGQPPVFQVVEEKGDAKIGGCGAVEKGPLPWKCFPDQANSDVA